MSSLNTRASEVSQRTVYLKMSDFWQVYLRVQLCQRKSLVDVAPEEEVHGRQPYHPLQNVTFFV